MTAASHLAGDADEVNEHDQVQDPNDPQERRRDARADVAAVAWEEVGEIEEGWAALPSIEEIEGRAR